MMAVQPQAGASFLAQYTDEQCIYDLFTPAASFPELELANSAVQGYSSQFTAQGHFHTSSEYYDSQATTNAVESSTPMLTELPQPNGGWNSCAWY